MEWFALAQRRGANEQKIVSFACPATTATQARSEFDRRYGLHYVLIDISRQPIPFTLDGPKMRLGTVDDLDDMMRLDRQVYPPEWLADLSYGHTILKKSPYVYRVVEVDGRLEGYYSVLPLEKHDLNDYLNEKIAEIDLQNYVQDFFSGEEIGVYLTSIVVNKQNPSYKVYSKMLLNDVLWFLGALRNQGAHISEWALVAITDDGVRISDRFAWDSTHTDQWKRTDEGIVCRFGMNTD